MPGVARQLGAQSPQDVAGAERHQEQRKGRTRKVLGPVVDQKGENPQLRILPRAIARSTLEGSGYECAGTGRRVGPGLSAGRTESTQP